MTRRRSFRDIAHDRRRLAYDGRLAVVLDRGVHMVLQAADGRLWDFWPTTGRFRRRGGSRTRSGGAAALLNDATRPFRPLRATSRLSGND